MKNENNVLYKNVMLWIVAQMAVTIASILFIAPLVPPTIVPTLTFIMVGVLLATAFIRKISGTLIKIMALIVPAIIGLGLNLVINNYVSHGAGDIILFAALTTGIVFAITAIYAYYSNKSLKRYEGMMFIVLIVIIVAGLLNTFLFHFPALTLIISFVTVVLFTMYTFIDIQRLRDNADTPDQVTAATIALNIFLDIINLFYAILNITSYFR